jgi:hypothetical protein
VLSDRSELFAADFTARRDALAAEVAGRTVLVIGAGGSIGRATAEALLALRPRRTLLVDLSENGLVGVTRLLRNLYPADAPDFEDWALDFTAPAFTALLDRERPDIVLNFAALARARRGRLTLGHVPRQRARQPRAVALGARQRRGAHLASAPTDVTRQARWAPNALIDSCCSAQRQRAGSEPCHLHALANVFFRRQLPRASSPDATTRWPTSPTAALFITPQERAACLLSGSTPTMASSCPACETDMHTFVKSPAPARHQGYKARHYPATSPRS